MATDERDRLRHEVQATLHRLDELLHSEAQPQPKKQEVGSEDKTMAVQATWKRGKNTSLPLASHSSSLTPAPMPPTTIVAATN